MFAWSSVCGVRPAVMGIVNVTPDSFSDGGRFLDPDAAVAHGLALVAAGADVLDVGGESTRPGATPVAEHDERDRVLPVVARLAAEVAVPISIDTRKATVAAAALAAGATVVNDVAAGDDPDMLAVVAAAGAGLVLMHMQGDPRSMQDAPTYGDVVAEVGDFLVDRVARRVPPGSPTVRSVSTRDSGSARPRRTTSRCWPASTSSSGGSTFPSSSGRHGSRSSAPSSATDLSPATTAPSPRWCGRSTVVRAWCACTTPRPRDALRLLDVMSDLDAEAVA